MWDGYDNIGNYDLLQECECCHDIYPLLLLWWNGSQFLCGKCSKGEK